MQIGFQQFNKLRGKGMQELCVRGRQELAKLGERIFGRGAAEMDDRSFLREFASLSRKGTSESAAASIVERIRSPIADGSLTFFTSLACREEIVTAMRGRFEGERRKLVDRADRAIRGRFDLLGLTDVEFGDPINWHLEPISGKRTRLDHWSKVNYLNVNVAGDKKITWELNRHQHFITLGQAYWMTGDERYAAGFVAQATSWMDANPPKLGINWASSLEVAFRSIAWLWALHFFAGSDHLTPRFVTRLLKYLVAHGRHIESYLSYYFSPNTHLTGEALGLLYLGSALPELSRANVWRRKGLEILLKQLPIHVRPDGVYFERASYYHRYTADFYTHLMALARASNMKLPDEVEENLALLLDHLMWITKPDGTTPLYGDDDGGRLVMLGVRRPNDFRDTLAAGAALLGRGDWKFVAGDAAAELLWLLGPEGLAKFDGIQARPPRKHSRAFADGGYFVMRDGWSKGSSYLLIDCGPHGSIGGGHAHADALSFEFSPMGRTWLVDPGTFTYTADTGARNEFRVTSAHNTITVDGQSQSLPAGPFSWGRVAEANAREFIAGERFNYFEGSHDGYEHLDDPVTHSRDVLFIKSDAEHQAPAYIVIRDLLTARLRHHYSIRYHFAAGCRATASDNRITAVQQNGDKLIAAVFGRAPLRTYIEQGWVSECYGRRDPAPVAVVEAEAEEVQEFVTIIIPEGATQAHASVVEAQALSISKQEAGHPEARGFTIRIGEALDVIIMGDGSGQIKCGPLAAEAKMAWGRLANGKLFSACFAGGRALSATNHIAVRARTAAKHCEIRLTDRLKLSLEGADELELALTEPVTEILVNEILVNGSTLTKAQGKRKATIRNEGSGWAMACEPEVLCPSLTGI